MTKYAKLKTERHDLVDRIRDYNTRATAWNNRWCRCPDNCHLRGQPHSHTFRQARLIRWDIGTNDP